MNKSEITRLINQSNPKGVVIDHRHRSDLQKAELDAIVREATKLLQSPSSNTYIIIGKC